MSKIYIVMGTTGEYSERSEWPVCAYTDQQQAQKHAADASAVAREELVKCEADGAYYDAFDERRATVNPYDPNMDLNYNGTSYFLYEVELKA